jgi:hypothetical protein
MLRAACDDDVAGCIVANHRAQRRERCAHRKQHPAALDESCNIERAVID